MLLGSTQNVAANELGKYIRTVRRWWVQYNCSKNLQHRKGAGRPIGSPISSLQDLLESDTSQRDLLLNQLPELVLLPQKILLIVI